jgi:hypothetical protein
MMKPPAHHALFDCVASLHSDDVAAAVQDLAVDHFGAKRRDDGKISMPLYVGRFIVAELNAAIVRRTARLTEH